MDKRIIFLSFMWVQSITWAAIDTGVNTFVKKTEPISLKEFVTLVLNRSIEYKSAKESLEVADITLNKKYLEYFPKIDLAYTENFLPDNASGRTYSISLSESTPVGLSFNFKPLSGTFKKDTPDNFSTSQSIDLALTVLGSGSVYSSLQSFKQSMVANKNSHLEFKGTTYTKVSEAVAKYFDMLGKFKGLEFAKDALEKAKQYLKETELKIRLGVSAKNDIYQARQNIEQGNENVIKAENDLQSSQEEMKKLVAYNTQEEFNSVYFYPSDVENIEKFVKDTKIDTDQKQAVAFALSNSPTYLVAKRNIELSKVTALLNKNDLLPKITLIYNYKWGDGAGTTAGKAFDNLYDTNSQTASIVLSYRLDPLDTKFNIRSLEISRANELRAFRTTEETLIGNVMKTIQSLQATERRLKYNKESLKLGKQKLDIEKKKYELGMTTFKDLVDFEKEYRKSRDDEKNLMIDYLNQLLGYYVLIGKNPLELGYLN